MKFKANTRRRALDYEKDWVQRWKADKTFQKSIDARPASNAYVFYDGPPFITGVPHHGTLLSSIVKDAVPRYWTMKGKRVERVWGWDCHGLPAENFVEKQLGITDRRQIVASAPAAASNTSASAAQPQPAPRDKDGNELPTITLEEYITKARESMVANSATWEGVIDRIGRWVDFKGAYRTMDKAFMESVWWAFKQLYDAGKIYEGEKVLMYDTKFATPVSKAEVTMDNDAYQTVTDPSVYVKFRLDKQSILGLSLKAAWAKDTSYKESKDVWSVSNPATGQCSITSLIVNDFFGGEIRKIHVGSVSHYFNVVDGRVVDLTAMQFGDSEFSYEEYEEKTREQLLADEDTKKRYDLLKSRLADSWAADVYILAWTTTPWTLPANLMLAVKPELTYCEVAVGGEKLIIAEEALSRVLKDEKNQPLPYEVLRKFSGSELVGKSYEPLATGSTWPDSEALQGKTPQQQNKLHKIYAADFVSHESGTGIVHIAPAYGEDDFELAKSQGVAPFHVIDDNGYYTDSLYKGLEVWDNNKMIAKDLKEKGIVWKIDYIRHEYPFNPRSKQRIMYRAIPSWFFDIQNSKPLMLEQNEHINWFPPHLKHGRFAKNIEQAPDWNLSRDRFWATAMPVWKGDRGSVKVVGSYAELKELSGVGLDDYHRPWVDDITFDIDGEHFTRIDKVLDGWFESGSMPFAQLHYPFENRQKFEQNYPADFIVEYIGQVRAWFYYVHVVNTTLADIGAFGPDSQKPEKNAFKNVITTGVVAGNDGRKMSKSLGNFTDPNQLMDKFSADSLRFLLLSSPLLSGEDFSLQDKDVGDVARKLTMIWNMYDFFTMYAEVDGWEFDPEKPFTLNPADVTNPLDKWIISRLHQLNQHITTHMDAYNLPDAMAPILPFIEDASNWYVRRSRRRFWKSEDDADKNEAYRTLHYVLLKLAVILAPFTPFVAEELYQKMAGGDAADNTTAASAPTTSFQSVHLLNWPTNYTVDQLVMDEMETVRSYVTQGLALRAKASLKVRQPLASVTVPSLGTVVDFEAILTDELNVKQVKVAAASGITTPEVPPAPASVQPAMAVQSAVSLDETITPQLKLEGLAREVVRRVQAARKDAGLNIDDRIMLKLATTNQELATAMHEFQKTIAEETLATSFEVDATTGGEDVTITLKKSA